jgi:hypothetical protein
MMLTTMQIELTGKHGTGKYALVDADDYTFLMQWIWRVDSRGYVARSDSSRGPKTNRTIYMHQAVAGKRFKMDIDHINRNTIDNRKSNLRFATKSANIRNQDLTKHPGINWSKQAGKWRARCKVEGREKHLGFYDDRDAAVQAVKAFKMTCNEGYYSVVVTDE